MILFRYLKRKVEIKLVWGVYETINGEYRAGDTAGIKWEERIVKSKGVRREEMKRDMEEIDGVRNTTYREGSK